jgi:hypothetical protein
MEHKQIDKAEVPAVDIVEARLMALNQNISIEAVGYDFDAMSYRFRIAAPNARQASFDLGRDLLADLRDNPDGPKSKYSVELNAKLHSKVLEAVETSGLISFGDEVLKFLLLRFIYTEQQSHRTVNKWNTIGKGLAGNLERQLRLELSIEEKDKLIWAWNELMRLRLIASTGTDLVVPDDWVKITEKGKSAVEGKSYADYAEIEIFIGKGEVYTAFRQIQTILQGAKRRIVIIDPYVDDVVLDFIAELDTGIAVQLATQHTKPSFKAGYAKLVQQRGNLEARCCDAFHDRFVILDGAVCYHFGSSLNCLGNKGTVISRKNDAILNDTLAEFNKAWQTATSV